MNENAASRASAIRCPGGRSAASAQRRRSEVELAGKGEHARAIDMGLDEIGDRLEPAPRAPPSRPPARGRDGARAARSCRCAAARRRPERRSPRSPRDEPAMTLAADAIDDHAGDFEPLVIAAQPLTIAAADCACPETSRTSRTGMPSAAATSAEAPLRPPRRRNAVEEAHRGFAERESAMSPPLARRAPPEGSAPSPRNRD